MIERYGFTSPPGGWYTLTRVAIGSPTVEADQHLCSPACLIVRGGQLDTEDREAAAGQAAGVRIMEESDIPFAWLFPLLLVGATWM